MYAGMWMKQQTFYLAEWEGNVHAVRILLIVLLCSCLIGCEEKKRAVQSQESCGIIKGIVMIDPAPYSISAVEGSSLQGTPHVTIQLLGESNTIDHAGGSDFGPIGSGRYRASFSLGAYDCNRGVPSFSQGVKSGVYSITFLDGYFDADQGRIPLAPLIVSKTNGSTIEVKPGETTNVGIVILTPP